MKVYTVYFNLDIFWNQIVPYFNGQNVIMIEMKQHISPSTNMLMHLTRFHHTNMQKCSIPCEPGCMRVHIWHRCGNFTCSSLVTSDGEEFMAMFHQPQIPSKAICWIDLICSVLPFRDMFNVNQFFFCGEAYCIRKSNNASVFDCILY